MSTKNLFHNSSVSTSTCITDCHTSPVFTCLITTSLATFCLSVAHLSDKEHTIQHSTFCNGVSTQVNRNNTGDNLTGSSTVLKLELTEVRLGGSSHQLILKDNDDQATGSQFQELGFVLCWGIVPCSVKLLDSTMITEQHPWRSHQTLEL